MTPRRRLAQTAQQRSALSVICPRPSAESGGARSRPCRDSDGTRRSWFLAQRRLAKRPRSLFIYRLARVWSVGDRPGRFICKARSSSARRSGLGVAGSPRGSSRAALSSAPGSSSPLFSWRRVRGEQVVLASARPRSRGAGSGTTARSWALRHPAARVVALSGKKM